MAPGREVGAAIYRPRWSRGKESRWSRGQGIEVEYGARNRHIINPRQLPRSKLDKPTYNCLKINGVDLENTYKAVEGERAPWQASRPTFVVVWPKLRRGVFWNLLELSFAVFAG